jgi:hypothetical protein
VLLATIDNQTTRVWSKTEITRPPGSYSAFRRVVAVSAGLGSLDGMLLPLIHPTGNGDDNKREWIQSAFRQAIT